MIAGVEGILIAGHGANIIVAAPALPDRPEIWEAARWVVGDKGRILIRAIDDIPFGQRQVGLVFRTCIPLQSGCGIAADMTAGPALRRGAENSALDANAPQRDDDRDEDDREDQQEDAPNQAQQPSDYLWLATAGRHSGGSRQSQLEPRSRRSAYAED